MAYTKKRTKRNQVDTIYERRITFFIKLFFPPKATSIGANVILIYILRHYLYLQKDIFEEKL